MPSVISTALIRRPMLACAFITMLDTPCHIAREASLPPTTNKLGLSSAKRQVASWVIMSKEDG